MRPCARLERRRSRFNHVRECRDLRRGTARSQALRRSLILDIVKQSGGTVVDLPDETTLASLLDWARNEGLLLCPEGACATAAYDQLLATGFLKPTDRVVLFNTGSGLKYTDAIAEAMHLTRPGAKKYPQRTPVGGIITPQ